MFPILYSSLMIQALLREADPKTMTRRTRTLDKINEQPHNYRFKELFHRHDNGLFAIFEHRITGSIVSVKFPYGEVGSLLWVRETSLYDDEAGIYKYAADFSKSDVEHLKGCWTPSIHMPKEACRIWLEITDVRVERLQDISKPDALSEGVEESIQWWDGREDQTSHKNYLAKGTEWNWFLNDPILSFKSLWKSINGEESWNSNPYVWAISFSKTSKPATL